MTILVVGAGVAGLACALDLQHAGRDVRVIEREPEPGGRVRSRVVDGYVVDRGFQVLFTAYPTLAAHLHADALALRRFRPAARVVTARGASLVGDALRDPSLLAPTVTAAALPLGDKLRLLALRRLATSLSVDDCFAPRWDARSARTLLRERGFSDAAIAHFFAPFYGGILLDPTLGTSAALLLFTFKMLAEGDTAVPAHGMGALTRQMADALRPGTLRTGVGVRAVRMHDGRACGVTLDTGETIDATDVVLATEPPTIARLAATAGVALASPDGALGCATLWYAAPAPPLPGDALWLNATTPHARVSHAVTITEVAPGYAAADAPHGRHLLAATLLGDAASGDDDALDDAARADVATMRARAGLAPLDGMTRIAVERVPYAQFAQPPGARARRTPATAGAPGLWRASETAHSSSLEGAARGGVLAARAVLGQPAGGTR